jgi:hypothetical protein
MTREIRLAGLTPDVITFNGFWAERPSRVRLTYEEEPNNGLWQLTLHDLESSRTWRFGAYLDGYENRRALYDIPLRYYYGRYIEDDPNYSNYSVTNDVITRDDAIGSDDFVIRLPDEWRPKVVVRIQSICGAGHPLAEPVLLGTLGSRYFALDCAGGLYYLNSLDELENWVRERECPEGHQHPTIHWWEWHIVRNGEVVHSEYSQPSPEEVIEALRRHLST